MPTPRHGRARASASPSPGPNGATPPSRQYQPESQIEVLYNQAVQSFVRKDHVKTQSILHRLLTLLKERALPTQPWNDFGEGVAVTGEAREAEEWTIKTLKLLISSHASLYADQSTGRNQVPPEQSTLLQGPPSGLLQHLQDACNAALHMSTPPLPPALLSTLLLASLKLKPSRDSLNWAHDLAEHWLEALDATFIDAISHPALSRDPEHGRRVESAREGYLKVIELFIGEVLAREGEWEMARALLEGEGVMGSKRRENLYRHLRGMEAKSRASGSASASPANSGILPSPSSSVILPQSPSPRSRSRSGSGSSSSSEATARPAADHRLSQTTNGTPVPPRLSNGVIDRKGKAKATDVVSESSASTMPQPLPNRFIINHGPSAEDRRANGPVGKRAPSFLDQISAVLPVPLQAMLRRLPLRWLGLALPLPLLLVALLVTLRRRKRHMAAATVIGGTATAASPDALEVVRERLRQARARGVWQWVVWWFRWWISKFLGVWKMGTTITYV